jgi:hypothetical protein
MRLSINLSSMHLKRTAGLLLVVLALLAGTSHAGATKGNKRPYLTTNGPMVAMISECARVLLAYVPENSNVLTLHSA